MRKKVFVFLSCHNVDREHWKIHRSKTSWITFAIYEMSRNSYCTSRSVFGVNLLINNPCFISDLFWNERIRMSTSFKCETYEELYWRGGVRNGRNHPCAVHPGGGGSSLFCLQGFCLARMVTAIRYQPLVTMKASLPWVGEKAHLSPHLVLSLLCHPLIPPPLPSPFYQRRSAPRVRPCKKL